MAPDGDTVIPEDKPTIGTQTNLCVLNMSYM